MRTLRLTLAVVAALTAAAVAGPAYAGHATVRDATGDVVDGNHAPLPGDRGADITRLDTTLTARRLSLVLHLRQVPGNQDGQVFFVKTPAAQYAVQLVRYGSHRTTVLTRDSAHGTRDIACAGLHQSRTAHLVRVTAPASCLGRPRWVRTTAGAYDRLGEDEVGVTGRFDHRAPHFGPTVRA